MNGDMVWERSTLLGGAAPTPQQVWMQQPWPGTIWAVISLFLLVSPLKGSRAEQFEVEGVWTSRYFATEKDVTDISAEFRVSVHDFRWYIRRVVMRYARNGAEAPMNEDYRTGACDGANIYEVSVFEQNRLPGSTNVAAAKIMSGLAPHEFSADLADLWLAFASHGYFRTVKRTRFIYPLLKASKYYQKDYRVEARWGLEQEPPCLPDYVAYSSLMMADVQENGAKPAGRNLIDTNVLYEVLEWTNFAGLKLPRRARVEKFFVGNRKHPMSILRERVSIEVSRVRHDLSIQSFTPQLPGLTALADRRFDSADPPFVAVVLTTNWPSGTKAERTYASRVAAMARDGPHRVARARVAIFVVFGLSLVFLVAILLKTKQARQMHTGT